MEGRAANRRADGGLRNQPLCSLPLYRGDGGSVFHCGFRSTDASLGLQVVPVRLISLGGVNFALREPARARLLIHSIRPRPFGACLSRPRTRPVLRPTGLPTAALLASALSADPDSDHSSPRSSACCSSRR